jgi:hypothetical protein
MTAQQIATQTFTITAAGAIAGKRGINMANQQAIANQQIVGVADHDAKLGENLRAIRGITAIVETGAAVNGSESRLVTDADGRFVPWATGGVVAARLKLGQTATGAGQLIEVYPVVNL